MAPKRAGTGRSSNDVLHVAILSDLHACEGPAGGRQPSLLRVAAAENNAEWHPIAGLNQLIKRERLRTPILLCAGDLGDRATKLGVKYGWEKVQEVGKWLHARLVVGTAGNHDLDSRFIDNAYDPREFLQTLQPKFPLKNEALFNHYWSQHYAIMSKPTYRIVVVNSCAYHGGAQSEMNHGRISEETLRAIRSKLEADTNQRRINILLCHHHPLQHQEINLGDYDAMKNGQLLLDMLGSGSFGNWIVVHGHKHHPKLCYASGGATSPVIFSAGSLSVDIQHELQGWSRNQFYILRMPVESSSHHCFVGSIDAWDWSCGIGWIPAGPTSGLPRRSGFGCRDDTHAIASAIAGVLRNRQLMLWDRVKEQLPKLEYLIPQDVTALKVLLSRDHQIELVVREDGLPYQIGRRTS
jgi:hypothetical protein